MVKLGWEIGALETNCLVRESVQSCSVKKNDSKFFPQKSNIQLLKDKVLKDESPKFYDPEIGFFFSQTDKHRPESVRVKKNSDGNITPCKMFDWYSILVRSSSKRLIRLASNSNISSQTKSNRININTSHQTIKEPIGRSEKSTKNIKNHPEQHNHISNRLKQEKTKILKLQI